MTDKKQFLEAGKIVSSFGIRGELKIFPWSDSPDFLKKFHRVFINGEEKKILSARVHKNLMLLLLEGISTPEEALAVKNQVVSVAREDFVLPEGRLLVEDMIGMEVFDLRKNRVIGTLSDILNLPAGDVYEIKPVAGGEAILIPAVDEFLRGADAEAGRITVETIEGMGDEN